jgi:hypothetical protein
VQVSPGLHATLLKGRIMATFKNQMASDAQAVYCNSGEMAESVAYVSADGIRTTINAVIKCDPALLIVGTDGQYQEADATALISTLFVGGIPSPAIEDLIVYNNFTWAVSKVSKDACDSTALLTLKRKNAERFGSMKTLKQ